MAGLVERYCLNLVLSWKTLVSLSMVIVSFAGYSSLGWHLGIELPVSVVGLAAEFVPRVCMTSAQDLLGFIVFGEKSGVILIGLPLYVT